MSFIGKKHIPRRTFLRGAGVTLALPLLDAMAPAMAQTAVQPKTRFVGIFFPHGMAPGQWEPQVEGVLPAKLPFILENPVVEEDDDRRNMEMLKRLSPKTAAPAA